MFLRLQSAVSLFTCSCLISVASAAPSNIGLVMTTGEIQIDGSSVRGNSALFSGSLISSGDANSSLQFSDGTNAVMKPGASMLVYREHSVLQKGITMQRGLDKHTVVADGLRISGTSPDTAALIGVKDATHVEVAGQSGEAEVRTAAGNLVARVEPGKTLSFALDAAAGTPANGVKLFGILRPHYLLTDEQTNITYQLQGSDLDALIGASVQVTGTVVGSAAGGPAPSVVSVSNIMKLGSDPIMAMSQNGPGAAPAATAPIWTTGSIIFLILVAVGGTLLALGAAGDLGGGPSAPVTPTSP